MKKLISNEGKEVMVSANTYNKLYAAYLAGVWSMIVTSGGKTDVIILPNNFS